ncbi:hypothetical protein Hdeb2414_s0087g00785731 [Helianthus debilis subsp. tardiflorus]
MHVHTLLGYGQFCYWAIMCQLFGPSNWTVFISAIGLFILTGPRPLCGTLISWVGYGLGLRHWITHEC